MPSMLDVIRRHELSIDEVTNRFGSFVYRDGSVQFEADEARANAQGLMKKGIEREADHLMSSLPVSQLIRLPHSLFMGVSSFTSWAEETHRSHGVLFWDRMVLDLDDTHLC